MGLSSSRSALREDELEEYTQLTYLRKGEIIQLFDKFQQLGPEVETNREHRYHISRLVEVFPELRYNPFRDRILKVFSSAKDDHFSFEDILDMFSVLSENCPSRVKATWAFKIFDFDDDKQISENDVVDIITKLTDLKEEHESLSDEEKRHIAKMMLDELDLDKTGGVAPLEFVHGVSKIPEFSNSFRLKI